METPWGQSDFVEQIAPGIVSVSTASHGGYRVDLTAQPMPAHLLNTFVARAAATSRSRVAWFEEDCDWSLVVTAFPQFFDAEHRKAAENTLRNWHPEAWEKHYGKTLAPGESHKRDEATARAAKRPAVLPEPAVRVQRALPF